MKIEILIAVLIAYLLVPTTNAAGAISGGESSGSNCEDYYHQGVLAIAGLDAGDLEVWSKIPGCGKARSNTEVLQWAGRMAAPVPTGTTVVAFAWAFSGVSGCTATTPTVLSDVGAAGSSSGATATLTMTSNECRAIMTATYTITVATIMVYQARPQFAIDIQVEQPNQMYLCGPTGLTDNAFNPSTSTCNNQQMTQCNADQAGSITCQDPISILQDFICGASGLAADSISNSATTCNIPLLAELNYLCDHSATTPNGFSISTNTCNILAANIANSGTQHLIVDSWPTMNVAGSITTTIAAWPTLSTSVGITSWPNLNIASVPTITINDQVHILDSVVLHHILDSGQLNLTGLTINQTVGAMNLTFPRELAIQLCGPGFIDTGVCHPVSFNGTATATVVATTHSLEWPAILALVIFVLIIAWAEIKKEKELYLLAVLVGAFEVLFLWPDITTQIRTLLIAITAFLAYRLWTTVNAENESD